MNTEQQLVRHICRTSFADLPGWVVDITKDQLLADLGTVIGGAEADGCQTVVAMAKEAGGAPEATVLIHGGKVPAQQAAFVNAVMGRALDFCDAAAPGPHAGVAIISAALAAAELAGGATGPTGATGAEFLTAVAVGTDVAMRMNLGEAEYDGFDPTGICVPFGAAAAAAKLLHLSEEQTWNALALAFCRCGGTFQANVDGSLAVRVIEGWVAETGVTCARLASRGITGPREFIEGVYGYLHLYGRDHVTGESIAAGIGADFRNDRLVFKKFPSCGNTQGPTQLVLDVMAEEGLTAGDLDHALFVVPHYIFKLVGHPFKVGSNPKVDAQFNIRFCAANALVRGSSRLEHFEEDAIRDPEVLRLAERIDVRPAAELDARGHQAVDLYLVTKDGREHVRRTDVVPGFPECPLSKEEHLRRFRDCIAFSPVPMAADKVDALMDAVAHVDALGDIREMLPLLMRD